MKNIYKFFAVSLIAALMFPNVIVFAENKKESITAEKLAEEIYVNLTEYREIELNDKREKYDDYTVKKYLSETERQIESNDKNIEQTEIKLKSKDISDEEKNQCHYQIEYLKIYNFELQKNKCYYEMQNKLSELYEEYSDKIVQNQKNKLKYETYKTLCEIKKYETQKSYLKSVLEQKKNEYNVVNGSLKIGYATENDVLSAKAVYETAKYEFLSCENNYTTLVNRLEKESGNKLSEFSVTFSAVKKYDSEKYLEQYKKQSFYDEYYIKQHNIYLEYNKSLIDIIKQMDKEYGQLQYKFQFEDNEKYYDRIYSYFSDEAEYYKNEAEIYTINAEKNTMEYEIYVTEACGYLNSLIAQRKSKLAEIKAADSSYLISKELFKEGRINESKLNETEIALKKLECERINIEINIMLQVFALDLTILSS